MLGLELFIFGFGTVVFTMSMLRDWKEKRDLKRMMQGLPPEQPEAPIEALWNYIQ